MTFETTREVLEWYEKQPRALTPEFLANIDWKAVKSCELDKKFVPVLLYMRDVESLTDVYYNELRRTPTGRDPFISKFMERWSTEEQTHGEILNRFLCEAGYESSEKWRETVKNQVSTAYTVNNYLISALTNLIGKRFTATHMTFGAIHEMSTTQGYRRLIKLAKHPILSEILNAVIREESTHTQFYASVARLELGKSDFTRKMARYIVKNFWTPVGQGSKPKRETEYTIAALFGDAEGLEWFDRSVSRRVQNFPGFDGLSKLNEKIGSIALAQNSAI